MKKRINISSSLTRITQQSVFIDGTIFSLMQVDRNNPFYYSAVIIKIEIYQAKNVSHDQIKVKLCT